MTYVAFDRLRQSHSAAPVVGTIGIVLALTTGCAPHSVEANGEDCTPGPCVLANSALRVVSVAPRDGAMDAEPTEAIRIEFDRELDPATVSAASIRVLDGDLSVAGNIVGGGRELTFVPRERLSLLTPYSIVVSQTVRDSKGTSLQSEFTSTFSVRDGTWKRTSRPTVKDSWLSGLTVDADGGFILGLCEENQAVHRDFGAEWSGPTIVGDGCFDYVLLGNGRGDTLAVSVDANGVASARQRREGEWQPRSTGVAELRGYLPQAVVTAAVAPTGDAHVVFVDDDLLRVTQTDGAGRWSELLSVPMTSTAYFEPVLAFDGVGNGLAAWVGHDKNQNRSGMEFVRLQSEGVGRVQAIPNSWNDRQDLGQPALAMTSAGDAAAVWAGPGGLFASSYTAGAWSNATLVNTSGVAVVCAPPVIVSDGPDFVVAWGETTGETSTPCRVYSSRWHASTWSIPKKLSDGGCSTERPPLLAADRHGNLMLLWATNTSSVFTRFNPAAADWTTPAATLGAGVPSAVSATKDGRVMVAYEEKAGVFTAVFE